MTRRFSSISTQTTLATSISNSALSLVVATGTASTLLGGVALTAGNVDQFKIIIDPDTASSEICYVTEVTSDTLTIARGKDGTSAVSHTGGAVIKHILTGEDLTYFTMGVVPTSNLAVGLPFPGSTSGTATVKAPAVAGTTVQTLPGTTGTLISAESTAAATTKATPVDADVIPLSDSAASGVLKSLSWANIKATLKTYFDTLYTTTAAVASTLASYATLASPTFTGVVTIPAGVVGTAANAGYMGIPQNAVTTGAATLTAADNGKHTRATATRTITIDSNANLALPIGYAHTFTTDAGATMTIAITTDTMYLAGPGTTGTRTLAPFGIATAIKLTSTTWMISGNGLT